MTDVPRITTFGARHPSAASPEQLGLPFLTAEEVAAVEGARRAIEQFHAHAVAQRRWSEADEMYRLGQQLLRLLDEHATRVRARR